MSSCRPCGFRQSKPASPKAAFTAFQCGRHQPACLRLPESRDLFAGIAAIAQSPAETDKQRGLSDPGRVIDDGTKRNAHQVRPFPDFRTCICTSSDEWCRALQSDQKPECRLRTSNWRGGDDRCFSDSHVAERLHPRATQDVGYSRAPPTRISAKGFIRTTQYVVSCKSFGWHTARVPGQSKALGGVVRCNAQPGIGGAPAPRSRNRLCIRGNEMQRRRRSPI